MSSNFKPGAVLVLVLASAGAGATPTLAQRTAAVNTVVGSDAACTSLTPFYWEIGDATGSKASGNGGLAPGPAMTASTQIPVASGSKWVFATLMVEKAFGHLSSDMVRQLTMSGGYSNFDACGNKVTVSSCLRQAGLDGGRNGDYVPADDGKFYYGGGHMQMLASHLGYGAYNTTTLTSLLQTLPNTRNGLLYTNPQLAGGLAATPTGYATFLRNLMNGSYRYMPALLGTRSVCTTPNSAKCPLALYSPVNNAGPDTPNSVSDEQWHYSLGHWVENDPVVGDKAFSSPGKYGFYPWIDASKQWYGMLARNDVSADTNTDPSSTPFFNSVKCGRKMRAAWISPP